MAGRGQHKVDGGNRKKKGNNQLEVWQREWWHGSHCQATSLQQTGGSAKWMMAKNQKKGNNQLEVQAV